MKLPADSRPKGPAAYGCSLLIVLAIAACGPTSDATRTPPSLDDLVRGNTEALGGRERLEGLNSVVILRNRHMLTVSRRPYFHKVELFDDDGSLRYAEGINGYVAWEQTSSDTTRRPVTGRPARALWRVLQWPGPLNPLYRMAEREHEVSMLADTVLDGTRYHRLLLTLSDGFRRTYFMNPETYQIERARDVRRLHATDADIQPAEGIWGDFRSVDGVVFPFYSEERNYETGERFWASTLLGVHVEVEVDDAEFGLEGRSTPTRLQRLVGLADSSRVVADE